MQTNTQAPSNHTAQNPWREREDLPRTPRTHQVFAAIAVFLAAVGQTVCLWKGISATVSEYLGILLLVLLCVYVGKVARSTPTLPLILCTAFLLAFSGMSFTGGAAVLAMIVSIGAGAFLYTTTGRPYLPLLCYVGAFAVCYAVTRDAIGSMLTLAAMPASLLMGFATLKGAARTRVICFAVAGLLLTAAVMIVFYLMYADVAFEREALLAHIDALRAQLTEASFAARDAMLETLKSQVNDAQSEQIYQQFAELYSSEMIRTTVVQLFNLLPALLIALCSILAYEANSFLLASHNAAGLSAVNTVEARRLTVSLSASLVFFLSFLLTLFIPSDHLANAVVQNLTVILLPALSLVGAHRLFFAFYRAKGGMRVFLFIAVGALLCCNMGGALYILAAWGAYSSVGDVARRALIERLRQNGGGDPHE